MAAAAPPQIEAAPQRTLLAPWWHTLILIAILLGASFSQAHNLGAIAEHRGKLLLYISTMVVEWVLVAFIWIFARRRGWSIRKLTGGRWSSPEDILLDVAIAGAFWIIALAVLAGVRYALGLLSFNAAENAARMKEMTRALGFLAPGTTAEVICFILLVLTAGFCEELIFRGYFQKQFSAATGSLALGILVQGILFGAAHGYQGWKLMLTIAVYGVLFGVLAGWRKSLRPGMIAHGWQDLISGLLLRALVSK